MTDDPQAETTLVEGPQTVSHNANEPRRKLATAERIRENADFHLGQEMARRQLAENETARLRAELAALPAPADRPAILREAAGVADRLMDERYGPDCSYAIGGADVARELRRMADCPSCEAGIEHTVHCPTPETHNWGCGCPTDPVPADGPSLMADEAQQPEAPRQWCKCPSCWGWFVEEHPGEDLDELGKDLRWWSGLPEHRDAPAAVSQPGQEA